MASLFGDLPTFWRYLAVNFLFLLIILGGLLLLVIPGIVWSVKYQFAPFLIVDRNLGLKEAFQGERRDYVGCQKGGVSFLFTGSGDQPAGADGLRRRAVYHPAGHHGRLQLCLSETIGTEKERGGGSGGNRSLFFGIMKLG